MLEGQSAEGTSELDDETSKQADLTKELDNWTNDSGVETSKFAKSQHNLH